MGKRVVLKDGRKGILLKAIYSRRNLAPPEGLVVAEDGERIWVTPDKVFRQEARTSENSASKKFRRG